MDGDVYVGEWADNVKNGKGVYFDKNYLWHYDGEWVNDMKSGKGK